MHHGRFFDALAATTPQNSEMMSMIVESSLFGRLATESNLFECFEEFFLLHRDAEF